MSPLNVFIPGEAANVRDFAAETSNSKPEVEIGERSSSFAMLIHDALARPEQDDAPRRSGTNERPAPASGKSKRKVRTAAEGNSVSDPTDGAPQQDDTTTTQTQDGHATSGSSENSAVAAIVVATLAQSPVVPQTSMAQGSASHSAPGAFVRAGEQVPGIHNGKPDSSPVTQAGEQQEKSEEISDATKPLATEPADSNNKDDPGHPPIVEPESRRHTNSTKHGTEIEAEAQAPPVGISGAQQEEQMKKAVKTDKTAELNQQNLPADSHVFAANQMVSSDKKLASAAIRVERTDPATFTAPVSNHPDLSVESAKTTTVTTAIPSAHSRLLEQTQELASLQVARLRESGTDSLSVVLKPADGIQISLQLQMRAGTVSAQASLHRGDFEMLSRHWPELQQRLWAQGVQLSSLQRQETSTSSHSHQPHQQSQPREQGSSEISRAGSMTEPPGKRARNAHSHRGWETWA
jgi:hypothetical protein